MSPDQIAEVGTAEADAATNRRGIREASTPTSEGRKPGTSRFWLAIIAIVAVACTAVVAVEARRPATTVTHEATTPAPIGLRKYMVFMADSVVGSLLDGATDGTAFQREVMRRTPAQIAESKAEAVDHYEKRFGLDFSAGDATEGAILVGFGAPDGTNYRAYTISGESVPSTGWQVQDGGWMAVVTAPGGTTLHGDWGGSKGERVSAGTFIPVGNYRINGESADGSLSAPIDLSYRALTPIPPMVPGTMPVFNCEIWSPEFGRGVAMGVIDVRQRAGGEFHVLVRNVLTFQ